MVLTVLSCHALSFSRARPQVVPLYRFPRFVAQATWFCVRKCLSALGLGHVTWKKICLKNPLKCAK